MGASFRAIGFGTPRSPIVRLPQKEEVVQRKDIAEKQVGFGRAKPSGIVDPGPGHGELLRRRRSAAADDVDDNQI